MFANRKSACACASLQVSGGLHGVGISVVNALSAQLAVTVWRGGRRYEQHFARGVALAPLNSTACAAEEKGRTGTQARAHAAHCRAVLVGPCMACTAYGSLTTVQYMTP